MQTIYLVRHAEKPVNDLQGVTELGVPDPESLIPLGWQRAGALTLFFTDQKNVATPDQIYAAAPEKEKLAPHDKLGSKSNRPLQTVTPLAAKLKKAPVEKFTKGQEADLVAEIVALDGTTLVCWQHEAIPQIAGLILGSSVGVPDPWPGDRFDVVWTFSRSDTDKTYAFGQVCQNLLAGDEPQPIQ